MDDAAQKLAKSGLVDMLDGGPNANPKPSLANGVPTIYVSQSPTELIVFKGQPDFVPVNGTQLLWAANTVADVFVDTTQQQLLRADGRALVSRGVTDRAVELRRQRCLAGGLRTHSAERACRRGAAHGGGHAAGAGGADLELDPADRDGAAEERAEVHADLRRPAAVRAGGRHHAELRDELVGAGDSCRCKRLLRGDRRRVVQGAAAHRPVDRGHRGAECDLRASRRVRRSTT